jgi:P-type Mg2+ transporter
MSVRNETQAAAAADGLTSQEAEARLKQFGPNDPAPSKHHSAVFDFLRLFLNPLVLILLIAAAVSAFLGEAADAAIIAVIVLLSTALDFTQNYQSRKAIEQLRQQVAPTATVLRDGKWGELRRSDVVPGDVVRLSAGDLVPGD